MLTACKACWPAGRFVPWAVNRSSAPKSLGRQKVFQLEGPDLQGNVVAASARPLSLLPWGQPWARERPAGVSAVNSGQGQELRKCHCGTQDRQFGLTQITFLLTLSPKARQRAGRALGAALLQTARSSTAAVTPKSCSPS